MESLSSSKVLTLVSQKQDLELASLVDERKYKISYTTPAGRRTTS